jgi:serine/threonine-protein kinase
MKQLGRYEILEELGSGAMGTVYRARDPLIEREVALKTVRLAAAESAEQEAYFARFRREAQAAGKLKHPGIVTIYDIGFEEATRTPYIVMEFVQGRTLSSFVAEVGSSLSTERKLSIVREIALALDYAHASGIVHRDIKPANILITPEGRAVITDFGVARQRKSQTTMQGQLVGTPSFMSPEQVKGERVDGRADLFSLGVILYWLLTGQKPFPGNDLTEVMFKVVYADPAPPTRLVPSLPPACDLLLSCALAKAPDARYQTGREFADDLERLARGLPLLAPVTAAPPTEATLRVESSALPSQAPEASVPLRTRATDLEAAQPELSVAPATAAASPRRWPAGRKLLFAALAVLGLAALILVSRGARTIVPGPQAALLVTLQHNFSTGSITVWSDDEQILSESLVADETHQTASGVRYVGRFAQHVQLAPGSRTLRVRIASPEAGFEQTRQLTGSFSANAERTLAITCDARRGTMQVLLR